MKKRIVATLLALLLICSVSVSFANESAYDKKWTVIVKDCNGVSTVYKGCELTGLDQFVITFIPGNGKEIRIYQNKCNSVGMVEE